MLGIPMPEVGLQRSRIMAGIGPGEAACVLEHVRMRLEIEAGSDAGHNVAPSS